VINPCCHENEQIADAELAFSQFVYQRTCLPTFFDFIYKSARFHTDMEDNERVKRLIGMSIMDESEFQYHEYHKLMANLVSGNDEFRPVPPSSMNRFAQKLLKFIRLVTSLDYLHTSREEHIPRETGSHKAAKNVYENSNKIQDWSATESRTPLVGKLFRCFIIYFGCVKLPVILILSHRMDTRWFELKNLLTNCSGIDLDGRRVIEKSIGPLLMNNEDLGSLRLKLDFSNPHLIVPKMTKNEYHCQLSTDSLRAGQYFAINDGQIQSQLDDYIEARKVVKSVGFSLMNKNFPLECCTVFCIIIALMTCLYPQVMARKFDSRLDFGLIRMVLSIKSEYVTTFELIRQQVNKLIRSSEEISKIDWRLQDIYQSMQEVHDFLPWSKNDNQSLSSMIEHRKMVQNVKFLTLTGQLQPYNKLRSSVQKYIRQFVFIFLTLAISCTIFSMSAIDVATRTFLNKEYKFENDPLDILFHIETYIQIVLVCNCCMFVASYSIVNCLNQIEYSYELSKWIRETKEMVIMSGLPLYVSSFDDKKTDLCAMRRHSSRLIDCSDDMLFVAKRSLNNAVEMELLRTFMRYKIFVCQFKSIRESYRITCSIILGILMTGPLIIRIYQDYLELELKNVTAYCSIAFGLVVDLVLVPLCHLNYLCSRIYKELSGLIAHAIGLHYQEEHTASRICCVRDNNIVWLLRKELRDPRKIMDDFNVNVFGFRISYAHVMRLHFYLGIYILSALSYNPTESKQGKNILMRAIM